MAISFRSSTVKRYAIILVAACAVSVLAACSSGTKLSDVPVEDRSGSVIKPPVAAASSPTTATSTAGTAEGTGASLASRNIEPVTIDPALAGAAGPSGAAKIIYFDYDSYSIKPEFQAAIDAHAKYLAANKGRKMAIEGHTDERGGREYNLALGQKRSEAVRRALALLGVVDAQIEAVSFGKEKPAKQGSDEGSFALNRRAEINYR